MNLPLVTLNEYDKSFIRHVQIELKEFFFDFNSCNIDLSLLKAMLVEFSKNNLLYILEASKHLHESSEGYVILNLGDDFSLQADYKLALTIILCGILHPFGIFEKFGLWKEIGVDINKEPNRSSGIGYNPFHIDFVNTTNPPVYSILFCVRHDPNKGGETIVSNFHKVIKRLNIDELEQLKHVNYTEGSFFGLQNVGREYNPFSILSLNSSGETIIRFSSKISPNQGTDITLINKIENLLIENQDVFLLKKNQMIIFNQRAVCHGRFALKGQQININQSRRRLILQTFGKKYQDEY